MEIRFKKLEETDLEAINQLDSCCFDMPWGQDKYLEEIQEVNALVLGAYVDFQLVGVICVRLMVDELWIFRIMTHPKYRRQKIAGQLVREAIAKKAGPHSMWLEVSVQNLSAIMFYEKEGFVTQYTRKGYYKDAGNAELSDAFVMKKEMSA